MLNELLNSILGIVSE